MKKGFTLLELLIGITIFAIVSGAIYTSLYLGIKVYKHEEKRTSNTQEFMLSFRVLEDSLYNTFMNPDNENITFKASSERIDFFAVNEKAQLENIVFYLEQKDEKNLFSLLKSKKNYMHKKEQAEPKIEVINNRISVFKLSYFDVGKKQWVRDWKDELSVPAQVRVEIDFVDSDNEKSSFHLEKYISIPIANEMQFSFTDDS